ncbi:hypothetical protein BKA62DRAFT_43793 [Auriculariales sp. MPI-PUGE-AT-0066]|nr:hypothetical protein BKA62DRAFT_43793 [Auriculariales sp. MPI-PUGE-AT-0066]
MPRAQTLVAQPPAQFQPTSAPTTAATARATRRGASAILQSTISSSAKSTAAAIPVRPPSTQPPSRAAPMTDKVPSRPPSRIAQPIASQSSTQQARVLSKPLARPVTVKPVTTSLDRVALAKLSRADLQKRSKDEGLKATGKSEALVDALVQHYASRMAQQAVKTFKETEDVFLASTPALAPSTPPAGNTNAISVPTLDSETPTNASFDLGFEPSFAMPIPSNFSFDFASPSPGKAIAFNPTATSTPAPASTGATPPLFGSSVSNAAAATGTKKKSKLLMSIGLGSAGALIQATDAAAVATSAGPTHPTKAPATTPAATLTEGDTASPRTRRARETQMRLGIGRPSLLGGSGARVSHGLKSGTTLSRGRGRGMSSSLHTGRVVSGVGRVVSGANGNGNGRVVSGSKRVASGSIAVKQTESSGDLQDGARLESISEDVSMREEGSSSSSASSSSLGVDKGKGKAISPQLQQHQEEMPSHPIVPIDVTPRHAAPLRTDPAVLTRLATLEASMSRIGTLETRVNALEAQNAALLARVAALEALRSPSSSASTFSSNSGGPPSGAGQGYPGGVTLDTTNSSSAQLSRTVDRMLEVLSMVARIRRTAGPNGLAPHPVLEQGQTQHPHLRRQYLLEPLVPCRCHRFIPPCHKLCPLLAIDSRIQARLSA